MSSPTAVRPSSRRSSIVRIILAVSVLAIVLGWPGPATAQEATPAVTSALTEACATLLSVATPPASGLGSDDTAPTFAEVPFDLLAIDTLTTHDEAVVALLTVALSGAQDPELRQFVESHLLDYQAETISLTKARSAAFPDAPAIPLEYQTGLLDQALNAAGVPAGSGEAPLIDPAHAAAFLCTTGESVPFDLAVIDLLSAELQNGVVIGLLTTQQAAIEDLLVHGQAIVDRETTMIGQLAIWRDAWFGPGAPLVVAPTDHGHEDASPSA